MTGSQASRTNQVRRLGQHGFENEFEYSERRWPANGVATLRVETYRPPPGANVLETVPANMVQHRLADGRLELHTQKIIPPDGSITVRIQYQLAQ